MALRISDIRTRSNVVEYLSETSPGWEHDVTNSWDAIAILLFSAALLGTTVPSTLAKFTGYDLGFVCAVAWNMRNNRLWTSTDYKVRDWTPETIDDSSPFWEEVSIGTGDGILPDAESEFSVEADMMDFQPIRIDRRSDSEGEEPTNLSCDTIQ